ncbi:MAG TPA: transketolase C-terminal domain-containing protein, partial [Jiangellaceae bacterium]|nr:transketolase C-terminal domain-containing protein [Jiangellaceae bacterium]
DGTVSVLLEPIALYHQRDLYADGDDGWLGADSGEHVPIGTARVHGSGADVTIITFGNGVRMSLRVAQRLAAQGVGAQVVDLRWLSPLPVEDILRAADRTGRVVVADETRHSGGVGEGVLTALVEAGYTGRMTRVSSADTFIPLGTAASAVLLSEDDIERATLALAHT